MTPAEKHIQLGQFAAAALQGLLAAGWNIHDMDSALFAVNHAMALQNELNKFELNGELFIDGEKVADISNVKITMHNKKSDEPGFVEPSGIPW